MSQSFAREVPFQSWCLNPILVDITTLSPRLQKHPKPLISPQAKAPAANEAFPSARVSVNPSSAALET